MLLSPEQRDWLQFFIQLVMTLGSVFIVYNKIDIRLTVLETDARWIKQAMKSNPFIRTPDENEG